MQTKRAQWLWVGLGGALGTLARAGIGEVFIHTNFPVATLIVNLVGSLLLGGFTAYLYFRNNNTLHWLFGVGFCGSFTTMSTFAADAVLLIDHSVGIFLSYVFSSVIGGLLLAGLGYWIMRNIYKGGQAA
ncbi:fluoride efflux transporter FluC [Aquisalibacillus elongatus]|uniref:Fluoride-specific ion channel FluC n=1 Tax=Aquisalibacillus elongatus TaxID=485577 RepID=A0A3N5C369_9BACI|nr:CrcB family protein [Aquisalibacillus elongatus]RPF50681.1 camphor resistance protein CrcB [Aquisalibacillus elongatus]